MKDFCQPARTIKAILLDMDDTIIADDPFTEKAWQVACGRYSRQTKGFDAKTLKLGIDEVREVYWKDAERHRIGRLNLVQARRDIVNQAFSRLGINEPIVANELADLYTREKERLCVPFPGALEALNEFKASGLRLALLTNGSLEIQRRKINRFKLAQYFDHILIEEELGVGKPDERVFRTALEKLKATPGESCMVGDDLERDISGAQKLGIFTVWVDLKKTGLPLNSSIKPDHIISSIIELV
jgi:putative hydrolase of the HAD superfamily